MSCTYDIDLSRINPDDVVTIKGDNIYDYTITDSSTSETVTIGQYINGNYSYISSVGGTDTSGNVNFGGHVDVSGNVNVNGNINGQINVSIPDINVNVTGGGTGTNIDASMPNMDPVQEYLDEANSQGSGVRSFLDTFFDFLTGEILVLVGIALSVAILCRIFGR